MKVAIITGSSSGIGRGAAIKFAQEGWNVVITGRNAEELDKTKKLCEEHKVEALPVVADMTVDADVERIMRETISRFSRLDCLVNNAGVPGKGGIETADLQQFDTVISTNLRSVFYLCQLAVPHLINSKGSVVNVSSAASLMANSNALIYGISKGGLDQLTKCLAMELASKQVRVNSVNPGYVPTNIFRRDGVMPEEQMKKVEDEVAKLHPLLRNGTVEEIANSIYFLADDASSFTTGCLLPVDGGACNTSSFYCFKPDQ